MRLTHTVLSFIAIAETAQADGAAIVAALEAISNDTISLNNTVSSWSGDLLGALPITVKSISLLIDINKGTETADDSAALTDTETLTVAVTVSDLIKDTNTTLTNLIDAKPKFDKLLLSPAIYLTLSSQKDASGKLSTAIVAKVSETFTEAAEALGAQLDDSFDVALDVYALF